MKTTIFKKTSYLVFFLGLLSLLNCTKNEREIYVPTLPEATQTGENTFGCYIDGVLLVPREAIATLEGLWGIGGTRKPLEYSSGGIPPAITYNEIDVYDGKSNAGALYFHIQDLHQLKEGTYSIKESNSLTGANANRTTNLWYKTEKKSKIIIYQSFINSGILTITKYDYPSRIISGTFTCRLVNRDDPTDFIEITQGRFDINSRTLPNAEFP